MESTFSGDHVKNRKRQKVYVPPTAFQRLSKYLVRLRCQHQKIPKLDFIEIMKVNFDADALTDFFMVVDAPVLYQILKMTYQLLLLPGWTKLQELFHDVPLEVLLGASPFAPKNLSVGWNLDDKIERLFHAEDLAFASFWKVTKCEHPTHVCYPYHVAAGVHDRPMSHHHGRPRNSVFDFSLCLMYRPHSQTETIIYDHPDDHSPVGGFCAQIYDQEVPSPSRSLHSERVRIIYNELHRTGHAAWLEAEDQLISEFKFHLPMKCYSRMQNYQNGRIKVDWSRPYPDEQRDMSHAVTYIAYYNFPPMWDSFLTYDENVMCKIKGRIDGRRFSLMI